MQRQSQCHIEYHEVGSLAVNGWAVTFGTARTAARPGPFSLYQMLISTASVPITVLLYNGPLLCGFNVPIKGLIDRCRVWSVIIDHTAVTASIRLHNKNALHLRDSQACTAHCKPTIHAQCAMLCHLSKQRFLLFHCSICSKLLHYR